MKFSKEKIDDLLLDHATPSKKHHQYPLLFIHGMLTGSWIFQNWMEKTAQKGWECWALNLRGYQGSRSVQDKGVVSLQNYVQDVNDALGKIGPSVLVGHSMGGLIAQIIASQDKQNIIKATVLMASAPPAWNSDSSPPPIYSLVALAICLCRSRKTLLPESRHRYLTVNAQ